MMTSTERFVLWVLAITSAIDNLIKIFTYLVK